MAIRRTKALYKGIVSILKGLLVTGRNIFRKPVTFQYPQQRPKMTDSFRGLVDLVPEKCICCLQCVKICPTAALDLEFTTNAETKKRVIKTFIFNAELCCFCGLCAEVCPTSAIIKDKNFEVACYDRVDLVGIDLLKKDKYSCFGPTASRKGKK